MGGSGERLGRENVEVKGMSKSVKVFMQLGTYEEKWESDKGATSPAVRFRAHQMFTQKTSFFLLLFFVSLRSCSRALEAENSVFGQLLFHGFQFMYVGGCFFGPTYTYSVLRIEMLCQIKFWGGAFGYAKSGNCRGRCMQIYVQEWRGSFCYR